LSAGGDRKLKLQDLTTKTPTVLHTWAVYSKSCGFTPDSRCVWSVGWDHAHVWALSDFSEVGAFGNGRHGAMSHGGTRLAVLTEHEAVVFELSTGARLGGVPYENGDTLCFSADDTRLILGGDGRGLGEGFAISVFDLATWTRVLPDDEGHAGAVEAMAIPSKRPTMLVSLGADRMLQVSDLVSGRSLERFGPVDGQGRALAVTADGNTVVTTTDTSQVLTWNLKTGASHAVNLKERARSSVGVALSPDETEAVWAPYLPPDPVVFDLERRATRLTLEGHQGQLCAVEIGRAHV
jgi:WD40 repeat protein